MNLYTHNASVDERKSVEGHGFNLAIFYSSCRMYKHVMTVWTIERRPLRGFHLQFMSVGYKRRSWNGSTGHAPKYYRISP